MSRCVLDSDIVIAALDRADAHHGQAREALTAMAEAGVMLEMSMMNYAETLVRPAEDDQSLRATVGAIEALGIDVLAPTAAIARDAARLRAGNISLADGFALATARVIRADVASFDRRVRRALPAAGLQLPQALRR